MSKRVTRRMREAVHARANYICEYCRCQVKFSMDSFSVEHIFPRGRGGKTELENLALSCQGCNGSKGTKIEAFDPIERRMAPLFHPRRQVWTDHFGWSQDFTQVVGLTSTGRATVEALELNRSGVANLRRILAAMNEHPP